MDVLALIPARGGSKGIPRKNLRLLGGNPLIAHTIEHALSSERITRTVVSTDDEEIADVARGAGAEVPFLRPAELAQDLSTDFDTFRHALLWLREEERYEPELVVHLRPTNPLRSVELIDEAIDLMLRDPQADSLRSVSRPDQTPYKMWRIEGGYLEPVVTVPGVPEAHSRPRQSLPEIWWQNGYVDVIRPRTILELGSMAGARVLPFIVAAPGIEIDYEDALQRAEELLRTGDHERALEPRHPA